MKSKSIALTVLLTTTVAVLAYPHATPSHPQPAPSTTPVHATQQAPKVEVVFALDTTGSMSGLIQAAKDNIWSIAHTMASAQPAPELRMGLVAYRDRGDAYVTRIIDLSDDLDSMYAQLMDFQAAGGGDGPEAVNQALQDAVHRMSWSEDQNTYRVIFLVGDAPPHTDYQDDVQYPVTLAQAANRGIVINAIQAGTDPSTRRAWQRIARLNQGEYFQVAQSGNAVAVATPFDDKIAKLSKDLDDTRVFYGAEEEREAQQKKVQASAKLHAESSSASRARRAAFNESAAGRKNFLGDKELVDDVASGRVELEAIAPAELPAAMQAMQAPERKAAIMATAKQRAALRDEIEALNRQRKDFIEDTLAKTETDEDSLDYRIFETVRDQAAPVGLSFEAAPSY